MLLCCFRSVSTVVSSLDCTELLCSRLSSQWNAFAYVFVQVASWTTPPARCHRGTPHLQFPRSSHGCPRALVLRWACASRRPLTFLLRLPCVVSSSGPYGVNPAISDNLRKPAPPDPWLTIRLLSIPSWRAFRYLALYAPVVILRLTMIDGLLPATLFPALSTGLFGHQASAG